MMTNVVAYVNGISLLASLFWLVAVWIWTELV